MLAIENPFATIESDDKRRCLNLASPGDGSVTLTLQRRAKDGTPLAEELMDLNILQIAFLRDQLTRVLDQVALRNVGAHPSRLTHVHPLPEQPE